MKIDSKEKLEQAIIFVSSISGKDLDIKTFEEKSGVGINSSFDAVQEKMQIFLNSRLGKLKEERYGLNFCNYFI